MGEQPIRASHPIHCATFSPGRGRGRPRPVCWSMDIGEPTDQSVRPSAAGSGEAD